MKTPIIIIGILVSIFTIFTACDNSKPETGSFNAKIGQRQDQNLLNGIVKHSDGELLESAPFDLTAAVIKDSALHVTVAYSGGCAAHSFDLIWPEAIIMIYPPQFDLVLTHNANGDQCEAYPTETLVFDLTNNPLGVPLSDFYLMKLGVVNGSNPDKRIDLNNADNSDCNEVACTKIFKTIDITIKDQAGHSVALDKFKVTNLLNYEDLTRAFDEESLVLMQQNGTYPLFGDEFVNGNQNRKLDISFIGYVNSLEVVNQKFTVAADCCHVNLLYGETEIVVK